MVTLFTGSIGEDRQIDVIDVRSQEAIVMNIKEFCEAFTTPAPERPSTLNCLSLEVSELPLGDEVVPPLVARMLCWVTNVWPQSIQERWEGGEPPQVQKYCIMSMEGSYTGTKSKLKPAHRKSMHEKLVNLQAILSLEALAGHYNKQVDSVLCNDVRKPIL